MSLKNPKNPSKRREKTLKQRERNSSQSTKIRARQRSGEGVVRRNGCPKWCFWRVRFFSAPLGISGPCRYFKSKPQGGREETDSPKTPFWTTVSPHDPFAAPLANPEKNKAINPPTKKERTRSYRIRGKTWKLPHCIRQSGSQAKRRWGSCRLIRQEPEIILEIIDLCQRSF